jgi:meso-butanediol dehydrogenase / (S,S)-butanediol dehydrogenase / diacetyl reductase
MPTPIPGRHTSKIAIVTGAGQGIGSGVAKRLAEEGAHVVVAEYNRTNAEAVAAELSALGPQAMAYPVDIGAVDQIQTMVNDVVQHFGRIDILVNNAGVNRPAPLFDLTPDNWDAVFHVNLRGLFFCMQAVAKQMVAQVPESVKQAGRAAGSHGSIVNFSSIAGRHGRPYDPAYSAAKWGVISLTQSAAQYLAPYNINVNAVCPGLVPTPMWEHIDQVQGVQRQGLPPGEWMQKTIDSIPLKRAATPADIAAVVSFLCSDDAEYITGQALNVDGGIEMN